MTTLAIFGMNVALSFTSSALFAWLYLWPRLQAISRQQALTRLVAVHMFFRYIGLSFVIPGVVSAALPAEFARPAAYGDLLAGVLAVVVFVALMKRAAFAVPALWLFNIVGAADLIFAFYKGLSLHFDPGLMGAAYFLPTTFVPPLLVTHFIIFRLLVYPNASSLPANR